MKTFYISLSNEESFIYRKSSRGTSFFDTDDHMVTSYAY